MKIISFFVSLFAGLLLFVAQANAQVGTAVNLWTGQTYTYQTTVAGVPPAPGQTVTLRDSSGGLHNAFVQSPTTFSNVSSQRSSSCLRSIG